MDKAEVQEILKKKTKKIAKLSDAILPNFDHDAIHALRVEVKKFRALLRLINTGRDEQEINIPKKFKRLYHIAGAIRDAQLEQKKILDWEISLPVYSGNLEANIRRQKGEWKIQYATKITEQLTEKMGHNMDDLEPEAVSRFFNERLENMYQFSNKSTHSNDQIHAIRKQVKDMLYNANFIEKKWEKGFEEIKTFSLKELNELSTVIGEYNDARIMLEHLSSFSSPAMAEEEKNAMTNISNKEMKRLQTEKKTVLEQIKRFVAGNHIPGCIHIEDPLS